jgi:hypothetical protein
MPRISASVFHAHILDLVQHHNIGWCTLSGSCQYGQAIQEIREIETPAIRGRLSYATALHEIGHIVGPYRNHHRYKTMMHEIGAWKWARRNALIWSPGMEKHVQECLQWYRAINPKFGVTNAEIEDRRKAATYRMNELFNSFGDDDELDDAA